MNIVQELMRIRSFLDDVEEGVYIYQTLDNILANKHGKQLMTEVRMSNGSSVLLMLAADSPIDLLFQQVVYLYGVMLLSVDMKLPGLIRERLIVAYQRYWSVLWLLQLLVGCKIMPRLLN